MTITLSYTVFRVIEMELLDKTTIEELQVEDQQKLESSGWSVEDPEWVKDDDQ